MSQTSIFGDETPVEELGLGPVQRLLAARERELEGLDPLAADEAGAIVHANRGKHSEDTRCAYCAIDGQDALDRLHRALSEGRGERVPGLGEPVSAPSLSAPDEAEPPL